MDGNLRWGTPWHKAGCDHLWSPAARHAALMLRWCLFCGTITSAPYDADRL